MVDENEVEVNPSLSGDGVEDVLEPDVPLAHRQRPAPRVHDARQVAVPAGGGRRGGAGRVSAAEAEEAPDVAVHGNAHLVGRRPARRCRGPSLPGK